MKRFFYPLILLSLLFSLFATTTTAFGATDHETCRPDGLYRTPGVATPYCVAYDTNGREMMGADHPRRIIGYFTSWRTGKDGTPAYLANNIPWDKLTHINFAFAHVDSANKVSVGTAGPNNSAIGMEWPGVAGAEMDPAYPYKGHFNLLNKFKKQYPNVKTLISIGGWAETGGYFDDSGNRVASGGFYTMTSSQANINTFADSAVAFIRQYGFNGVDIDYEYATSMNNAGNPLDWSIANGQRGVLMKNFAALMKTLREKLDAASAADGKYYMLTVAAPSSAYLLRGMEYYQVTQYLDYVNIMSYDLHGSWNEFVGPNAALYDDGQDAELVKWNYYTTSQYGQIGYLNTDWAYHYFRGSMPAGRINIGVPYYTRGWRNVVGGTNGLWGKAGPLTSGCATGLTACGDGAVGIDNLWHDTELNAEVPAGSNPMWHAKNLENNILPSYLSAYGLSQTNPANQLTGTYTRYYSAALVAPWLWNAQKKVFLSTEDDQSLGVKAQYVIDRGIGGVMFWELAGDYKLDTTKNEYTIGNTMTNLLYDRFKTASAYGNITAKRTMPTQTIDVNISLNEFALGDNNYPINPKMKITNNSTTTIPGGAEFQFNYGTSAPGTMADQSGFGLTVLQSEHTGNNLGGLKGDYHLASFKLPTWQSIAPGASIDVATVYYLPITAPSNFTITFGGQSYRLSSEYGRGSGTPVTVTPVTPTLTFTPTKTNTPVTVVPSFTPTKTNTPGTPTVTFTPTKTNTPVTVVPSFTPTKTNTPVVGSCTSPAWSSTQTYNNGNTVSWIDHEWKAQWWTLNEAPGTTGQWGVWLDLGPCSGGATNTPTKTSTPTSTGVVVTSTFTPTKTNTPVVTATKTNTPTITPTTNTGAQPWAAGVSYTVGNLVTYGGKTYKCLQNHTSLTGWEPPNVPALWQLQ